jgi:methyl-accepting chemotaxis protein
MSSRISSAQAHCRTAKPPRNVTSSSPFLQAVTPPQATLQRTKKSAIQQTWQTSNLTNNRQDLRAANYPYLRVSGHFLYTILPGARILVKNISILQRIFILAGLSVIVLAGALAYSTYKGTEAIVAERKAMLVAMNDVAISAFKRYHELETSGAMTRDAAQKAATAEVMNMRYGKQGYFWINDFEGLMLAHPTNPKLVGVNRMNIADKNGKYNMREFVAVAKGPGAGFVDYFTTKPGETEEVQKYSHVVAFKPWGWIVGTGVYGDDIVAIQTKSIIEAGIVILLAIFINLACAIFVGRSISRPINALKSVMGRVAANDTTQEVPHTGRRDEIGEIADALVLIRNSVIERNALESSKAEQQAAIEASRSASADAERRNRESQEAWSAVLPVYSSAFRKVT